MKFQLCIFSEAEPVLMRKNKQCGKQLRIQVFQSSRAKFPLSSCARIPRGICTHKSLLAYIWHTQGARCLAHCSHVLQLLAAGSSAERFGEVPLQSGDTKPDWGFCWYSLCIRLTVACHFLMKFLQPCTHGIIKRGAFHSWQVEKILPHPWCYSFILLYL